MARACWETGYASGSGRLLPVTWDRTSISPSTYLLCARVGWSMGPEQFGVVAMHAEACRTSSRSGFGFARGGRLHRGHQECNAEKALVILESNETFENTELSPWND